MRMLLSLLLAAVALPAQAASARPATQGAPANEVGRLVALLAPDASIVAMAAQLFDAHVRDPANLPAEVRTLFADDPALKAHVAGRVRSEAAGVLRQELPALRTRLAALVRSAMTPREIGDSLTFFSTATGRKMLARAYRGVGEAGATSEEDAERAAITAVMQDLAPEDYSALFTFGASPAAQKFQALRPRISETSRRWGEEVVTRHQNRLERIAVEAIAGYRARGQ